MKKQELNTIIDILELNSSEEKGYIDLYYDSIEINEERFSSGIRSNKEGLLLFAKELLIGFRKIDNSKNEIDIIKIDGGDWFGHDIKDSTSFIKPIYKTRDDIEISKPYIEKWNDKLVPYFLMFGLLLFIIGVVGGVFQIIDWSINK